MKDGNPKPPIKPSKLESTEQGASKHKGKHRGKHKRSKTRDLEIHEEMVVAPVTTPPADSRFKGYDEFTVQDLVHRVRTTPPISSNAG